MLLARGIPGIILSTLPDPVPEIDFDWSGFACSTVGYSYKKYALNRVANDQFNTMRKAVDRLRRLGFRRIGLAIRYEDDFRVEGRWVGGMLSDSPYLKPENRIPVFLWHYQNALRSSSISPNRERGEAGNIPEGFHDWVHNYRPDAIISLQPAKVESWLDSIRVDVPRDIEVINLNIQAGETRFRGMDQNNSMLGGAAVELVVEQIHHNQQGIPECPKTVLIMGNWVDHLPSTTSRRQGKLC